jgi:hypothetical protein
MRHNERVINVTDREEVIEDYNEFGVFEILAQYIMNPYAEEVIVEHIKNLEEEVKRLETELMMLR